MTSPNTSTPADPRVEVAREYADVSPPDGGGRGLHPHVLGILLVVFGLALINTSDAIAKWTIEDLPLFLVILFQAIGLMALAPLVAREPRPLTLIHTPDPRWQAARSVCQLCSGLSFYAGLQVLQFADVVAILFIGPLVVSALAHVFLGEHVGPRRWAACGVGLIGGLIIVRPGTEVMGWAAVWPVLAVCFWSVYIVITRRISPRNSTGNMMLWASLAPLTVSAVAVVLIWQADSLTVGAMAFSWQPLNGWQWAGLIAIGLMSAVSNGVTIRAYSIAPASLLAPFSYLEIVGAVLFGWFIWQEFPDAWTWIGAAIIVAAGLYVLRREAVAARKT